MNFFDSFSLPLHLAIIALWGLSALFDYLDFASILQLKEYRLDRLRDFWKSHQGQHYIRRYGLLWRTLLCTALLFWPINPNITIRYILLALFSIDALRLCGTILKHKLRRPKITIKVAAIISVAFLIEIGLALYKHSWDAVFGLIILRPFIIALVTFASNNVTQQLKNWYIYRATKKIARFPNVTVIGITGSYGKSTVKEYTSHILGKKFRVLRTPGNINTDIGVAMFVLRQNLAEADVLVVEMGAYKIGEIDKICQMVKPKIAVLTAIIEQHLILFGSIENVQQAKYELLRAIPANGLVVTNADNTYCVEFLPELACKNQQTFGEELDNHPTLLIDEAGYRNGFASGQYSYQGRDWHITAPVVGAHQVTNLAPAVMVATHLGMSQEEITVACATLPAGDHGLKIFPFGQATIIDDSYNSNPAGFSAALEVLSSFPSSQSRVVITRGMLELGDRHDEIHETIAEEIAFCADTLVIITPDAADALQRGVDRLHDKFHLKVEQMYDSGALRNYLVGLKETSSVILLENRVPETVRALVSSTH